MQNGFIGSHFEKKYQEMGNEVAPESTEFPRKVEKFGICTHLNAPLKKKLSHCQYLRGDVVWCPHSCSACHLPILVHSQTGAKVRQPDVAVFVDQHIVWLDVPTQPQIQRVKGHRG